VRLGEKRRKFFFCKNEKKMSKTEQKQNKCFFWNKKKKSVKNEQEIGILNDKKSF
jgi:hypothetical protein